MMVHEMWILMQQDYRPGECGIALRERKDIIKEEKKKDKRTVMCLKSGKAGDKDGVVNETKNEGEADIKLN